MELNGEQISLVQLAAVALGAEPVHISSVAPPRILASRKVIEQIVARDVVVYGVNTGFGKLSDVRIPQSDLRQLQLNLVRSHACGIGNPLSEAEVRAMILLRANVLALGFSGVRLEIIQLLCEMLNRRVYPVVPEKGSVGASGDLAPLAHLALSLIGEGEAFFETDRPYNSKQKKAWHCSTVRRRCTRSVGLLFRARNVSRVSLMSLVR
jgi:histidine ammonia-lyase